MTKRYNSGLSSAAAVTLAAMLIISIISCCLPKLWSWEWFLICLCGSMIIFIISLILLFQAIEIDDVSGLARIKNHRSLFFWMAFNIVDVERIQYRSIGSGRGSSTWIFVYLKPAASRKRRKVPMVVDPGFWRSPFKDIIAITNTMKNRVPGVETEGFPEFWKDTSD
jgi:hypothetical protein